MRKSICIGLAVFLLAGFCACGRDGTEPTGGAATTEETPTQAATTEFIPGPVRHTVVKRIHESLPEFTFTLYGDPDAELEDSSSIHTIVVSAEGFYQKLDGIETVSPDFLADYGLSFSDFNGDGYLDIQLFKYRGGTMRNEPSIFWLWDGGARGFVRNEQLEELAESAGVSVEEDGRVSCYTRLGVGEYVTAYYSYKDGVFVLVETVEENE